MQTINYRRFYRAMLNAKDYDPMPYKCKVQFKGEVEYQLRPICAYYRALSRLRGLLYEPNIEFSINDNTIRAVIPGTSFTAEINLLNYPQYVLNIIIDAILPNLK